MYKKTQKLDLNYGISLYVLKLQNGKYYVGITHDIDRRIRQHENGETSSFVKENLPIKSVHKTLLKTTDRNRAFKLENYKTVELVLRYGIENVCGGDITGDLPIRYRKFLSCFYGRMKL